MALVGLKSYRRKRKKMQENLKRFMDGFGFRLSKKIMAIKFLSNKMKKVKKAKKVKKVKESKGNSMPEDLLFDIWSRLPAHFLWSLRSVCKGWQSLIESPDLADLHLPRSKEKEELSVIFWDEEGYSDPTRIYSIDDDGGFVRVVEDVYLSIALSSTDGLICYYGNDDRIRVHNPVTRELLILPTPNFSPSKPFQFDHDVHQIEIALGFDTVIKRYKVMVVLTQKLRNEPVRCAPNVVIYTLERGLEGWRNVEVPNYYWDRRFYANGSVFWLRYESSGPRRRRLLSLIKFNFPAERFESVPLPPDNDFLDNIWFWDMWEVRGSLYLYQCQSTRRAVVLWTLAKSGEWVDCRIDPSTPTRFYSVYPLSTGRILANNFETMYMLFYNQEGQALRLIKLQNVPLSLFPTQLYSGSLVSLKRIGAAAVDES